MLEDIDITFKLRIIIAQNLKSLRKKHGITQEELADRTGINRVTITRYERGQMSISLEKLLVICKALNESPNTILNDWEKIF